jgi:hypothetical protein
MFSPKTFRYLGIFTTLNKNPKPHIRTTVYALYLILAFLPHFPDCRGNMNTQPTFLRRIGSGPQEYCAQTAGCPDIWELDNGDFAVIGRDITDAALSNLPPTAGCGPDERIVRLPRNLLVNAKRDIPDRP